LEGVEQSFGTVSRNLADCKVTIHNMELAHHQQLDSSSPSKHPPIVAPLTEEIDRRVDASRK